MKWPIPFFLCALACGGEQGAQAPQPTAEAPGAEMQPIEAEAQIAGAGPSTEAEEEAPVTPVPGSLRLVILREHELLGSESRAISRLEEQLARGGRTVDSTDPSDEERTTATAWLAGPAPEGLPGRWRSAETVIVLRVLAPQQSRRDGRRFAGGAAGTLVLRPPSVEPIFVARVEDATPWSLDDRWGPWLVDLLEGVPGGGEG